MRSLDLYSEKQMRDGSPDKIAASTAFVREANSLSLASLTTNTANPKDATPHSAGDNKTGDKTGDKTGLLSLFTDMPDSNKSASPKELRDKRAALSAGSFNNPLSLFGMSSFSSRDGMTAGMTRQELQIVADRSVVHERMQRVIARQAFLLKERKLKSEKGEGAERVNDTTVMSALDSGKKHKLSFVKDKVSIANGVSRPERNWQSKQPRDYVKENKLLKKKQMLVDYLEKFRGKLSLQEVSEVISQMEKLDKALLLMTS